MTELEEESRRMDEVNAGTHIKAVIVAKALAKSGATNLPPRDGQLAFSEYGMPVKWACDAVRISETSYRYEAKLQTENDKIADWLICVTDNNRNGGCAVLSLASQHQELCWESHARVSDLPRSRTESANQTAQTISAGSSQSH